MKELDGPEVNSSQRVLRASFVFHGLGRARTRPAKEAGESGVVQAQSTSWENIGLYEAEGTAVDTIEIKGQAMGDRMQWKQAVQNQPETQY